MRKVFFSLLILFFGFFVSATDLYHAFLKRGSVFDSYDYLFLSYVSEQALHDYWIEEENWTLVYCEYAGDLDSVFMDSFSKALIDAFQCDKDSLLHE